MRNLLRLHYAVLFSLFFSVVASAQQPDYVVSQKFRLSAPINGLNGWLEVLTDSRLTPDLRKEMWGVGDWSFALPEGDSQYAVFKAKPPRNAQLRIASDKTNQEPRTFALDRPLARIKELQVVGSTTSFLVAVDYSMGFGSYAGVTTQLVDVRDGQFRWAESTSVDVKDVQTIRLPDTLKSAWRLVPFRDGNKEILLVYCRPAKVAVAGREFVVGYVRYRFDGQRWLKYERLRNGFWESDQPFPSLSSFP